MNVAHSNPASIVAVATRHAQRMHLVGIAAITAVILSLVIGWSSAARANGAGDIVWTATKVEGAVTYREGGNTDAAWLPLRAGALLSSLAELRTGTNGRAELSFEGSTIVAAPNSEFRLPGPTPKSAVYRVTQKIGTFLYKIKHASRDKFEVQTPFLTTIIKGTVFTVLAGPEGSSVHVTEGAVFVQPSTGTGGAFVRPGETARVAGADRGTVTIQGANGPGKPAATPREDQRSDAGEGETRGGKPVKIVFREAAPQFASIGDDATARPGNGNARKEGGSGPDSEGLQGNGNGNGGLGAGNGNAGNGNGNGGGLGGGNGNAGGGGNGNAGGGGGGGLGGGNGNAGGGGNGNAGGGGNPNAGGGGGNPNAGGGGNGNGNGRGRS